MKAALFYTLVTAAYVVITIGVMWVAGSFGVRL